MANINLLPWREEKRQEAKREFFGILAGCVILGASLVYLLETKVQTEISQQQARNKFIQNEEKQLDESIAEIKELRQQREELVARMEVIQNLQGNRSIVVHIFDEIARTVPDGIHLTSITKEGKRFTIQGFAEANNRIARYMRSLNDSEWFDKPNLTEVKSQDDSEESTFQLTVEEFSPNQANADSEEES